jgi:hypothetical protein
VILGGLETSTALNLVAINALCKAKKLDGSFLERRARSAREMVGPMRIAVIGAGSAGMTAAKQIVDYSAKSGGHAIDFTVFERQSNVGGIWQYFPDNRPGFLAWETDQAELIPIEGIGSLAGREGRLRYGWKQEWPPGAMFDGLRTNIACDLMTYRDTPFAPNTNLFPSRQTVQSYLEDYARSNDLYPHIQFETAVTKLKKEERGQQWLVTTQSSVPLDPPKEEYFTHVLVCHGRCSVPNIPSIPGIETFKGKVSHSAWYRDPSVMKERNVLIVGNASSGMDIARELAGYLARDLPSGLSPDEWREKCKEDPFKIYSSWHSLEKAPPMDYNPLDPDSPDWSRKIQVKEEIDHIRDDCVYFKSGSMLDTIELIIFATGFLFDSPYIDQSTEPLLSRPFLPPSKNASRTGFASKSMCNLDDWLLFHSHDESIAFLGLPITVVPFPFTEVQAAFVLQRWLGMVERLPRLDRTIPTDDPDRWSSRGSEEESGHEEGEEMCPILRQTTHVFGHPSELVYVNSLLSRLALPGAGQDPPWQKEYTSDGQGHGGPRGLEGRYATAQWRIERRTNGKTLRRETLGY